MSGEFQECKMMSRSHLVIDVFIILFIYLFIHFLVMGS